MFSPMTLVDAFRLEHSVKKLPDLKTQAWFWYRYAKGRIAYYNPMARLCHRAEPIDDEE
jgi:hypothetical protein